MPFTEIVTITAATPATPFTAEAGAVTLEVGDVGSVPWTAGSRRLNVRAFAGKERDPDEISGVLAAGSVLSMGGVEAVLTEPLTFATRDVAIPVIGGVLNSYSPVGLSFDQASITRDMLNAVAHLIESRTSVFNKTTYPATPGVSVLSEIVRGPLGAEIIDYYPATAADFAGEPDSGTAYPFSLFGGFLAGITTEGPFPALPNDRLVEVIINAELPINVALAATERPLGVNLSTADPIEITADANQAIEVWAELADYTTSEVLVEGEDAIENRPVQNAQWLIADRQPAPIDTTSVLIDSDGRSWAIKGIDRDVDTSRAVINCERSL